MGTISWCQTVKDHFALFFCRTIEILFIRVLNKVFGSVDMPEEMRLHKVLKVSMDSDTIPPVDSKAIR